MAIIVFSGGQIIFAGLLLGFHCYISCCLDVTTLMFIESDLNSNGEKMETEERLENNRDEPSPSSLVLNEIRSNNKSK